MTNSSEDDLHREAIEAGKPTYVDPETGYPVITAAFLEKRGYCCHSGCRHCPYGFTPTPLTPPPSDSEE